MRSHDIFIGRLPPCTARLGKMIDGHAVIECDVLCEIIDPRRCFYCAFRQDIL